MSAGGGDEEDVTREAFLSHFRTEERSIQEAIEATEGGGRVHESLDGLLARARELEGSFTRAARLLAAYDVQRCSAALEALTQRVSKRREELAPRGRFAFRRKAPPQAAVPPAAAEAAAAPSDVPSKPPADEVIGGSGTARRFEGQRGMLLFCGSAELDGRDVVLHDLEDCRVLLLGVVGALRCQGLRRCEVSAAAVASSALLHDCRECVLTLAAKQLRLHDSEDVLLHLRTLSRPALERSRRILVAPFDLLYPGLDAHLAEAALGAASEEDAWAKLQDFDWHRRQASPHWQIVPLDLRRRSLDLSVESAKTAQPPEPAVPDLSALEHCRSCWAAEPQAAEGGLAASRSGEQHTAGGAPGDDPGSVGAASGGEPAAPKAPVPVQACGVEALGSDDEF